MSTVLAGATDDRLAQLARAGDRDALEILLRRHYDTLRAVCHRIVIDAGNADDAAQNTMLSIARGIRRFDGRSSVTTWMHRIAVNASLDEIRRSQRRPRLVAIEQLETIDSPSNVANEVTDRILVHDALLTLEPEFRVVLALRHLADLEYEDIARELDLPVGTVKSRISRGRLQLATVISDNDTPAVRTPPDARPHQGEHRGDT